MTTKYTDDHEWVAVEGEVATFGITHYAQEQLGELVYVELPEVGAQLEKGGEAAVVESVKAASDVYSPLTGEVVEVNEAVSDEPTKINEEAESGGWIAKIKLADPSEFEAMMDRAAYDALIA